MSEIIAETNGTQGILIADTMITRLGEDGKIIKQWDERKIFGTHCCRMINACAGTMAVGHNMIEELENMESIFSGDLYRIYDKQLLEWKQQGIDASSSVVFSMYTIAEQVKIAYCVQNREKNVYELVKQKKVLAPGDTNHVSYLKKSDLRNICSREHLAELVREFIDISEQSQYVSDTCCIATMNHWGIIQYYEDNMYKMIENIEQGKMKSDIGILAQSTPKFIRYGIQKSIP